MIGKTSVLVLKRNVVRLRKIVKLKGYKKIRKRNQNLFLNFSQHSVLRENVKFFLQQIANIVRRSNCCFILRNIDDSFYC